MSSAKWIATNKHRQKKLNTHHKKDTTREHISKKIIRIFASNTLEILKVIVCHFLSFIFHFFIIYFPFFIIYLFIFLSFIFHFLSCLIIFFDFFMGFLCFAAFSTKKWEKCDAHLAKSDDFQETIEEW